ncbi:glycosyl transferase family 90-domain-containing protein [Mycena polygramma]|nr:glycosyl transferase family 90-domain-containing protein [Mycena polygramma]
MPVWLSAFFKIESPEATHIEGKTLLPYSAWHSGAGYEDHTESKIASFKSRRCWALSWMYTLIILTIVCLLPTFFVSFSSIHGSHIYQHFPHHEHSNSTHAEIDALFARQSSTLSQVVIGTGRATRGGSRVKKDGSGMTTGRFGGGRFRFTDWHRTLYTADWSRTFARLAALIPDTNIIINGRDEPRVVFDYRRPRVQETVFAAGPDPNPFEHTPQSTAKFFKDRHCHIPNQPLGFTDLANDASAFMLSSSSTQFTTDLYPLLSAAKISPCFADILVPSEFYYSDSRWTPRYAYPNNIAWNAKIPRLYWRGKSSGGRISGSNYRAFPRFRAADIGRAHPDLMDVAISGFHDSLCGADCDAAKIKAEYNITGASVPRENVYRYKYVLDVDGNSFSGRYLGLLRSGSLVFKSTVFEEYFSDWLRPFYHYIPVLPDLSDLVQKIEWAIANDEEARAIQEAGQAVAERVLTDAQNDCYFSAVLLDSFPLR